MFNDRVQITTPFSVRYFYFHHKVPNMSCVLSHGLCVSALIPILRGTYSTDTRIQFTDEYVKHFKRLGIRRDEMMVVMNQILTVDVLVGDVRRFGDILNEYVE